MARGGAIFVARSSVKCWLDQPIHNFGPCHTGTAGIDSSPDLAGIGNRVYFSGLRAHVDTSRMSVETMSEARLVVRSHYQNSRIGKHRCGPTLSKPGSDDGGKHERRSFLPVLAQAFTFTNSKSG